MHLKFKLFCGAALALAIVSVHAETAPPQDDLKSVLDRLNVSAAKFRTVSADVEFDTVETDPVPDTDVQKGVIYYDRKDGAVRMGVHMSEHNGKPSAKAYTYIDGMVKLFEPGINQVTSYNGAAKWESYIVLGMGASGKDLQAKWNIAYKGEETVNGVKTEKLELVAKDPEMRKSLAKVDIWLDADHAVSLKQVFTFSSTSTYVSYFKNFKFNESLPRDAFTFKTNGQTVYRTQ
jgi:outer membrane lipoprotein-sorting protein